MTKSKLFSTMAAYLRTPRVRPSSFGRSATPNSLTHGSNIPGGMVRFHAAVMTLSKALRWKKRAIEKVRKYETEAQTYNCHIEVEGEKPEIDVATSFANREKWVKHLIALKLALIKAAQPIQEKILLLAEIKSEIAFLQRVPTTHGTQKSRYKEEADVTYVAFLRKAQVEAKVQELQDQIDRLQTEIDAYNAETILDIEIPE